MSGLNDKETMREVSRELRPDWTDEQFDAHWDAYVKMRWSVARGRRKQAAKRSRANSATDKLTEPAPKTVQ